MTNEFEKKELLALVRRALQEDMPSGDLTTDNLQISEHHGRARLVAKEDLVLSGQEVFNLTFQELDPIIKISWQFKDGDLVLKNQTLCVISGKLQALLKAERVALNFLGHLSGIATLTQCFVSQLKSAKTKILDTRKTTPGLRQLEKQAVRHGGGHNHRLNLSAGVLIKENHIRSVGGIKNAVTQIRRATDEPIEVEVQNLDEVKEAIECKVQSVLLDNMSTEDMKKALQLTPATIRTEASGNMTLERISEVSAIGVDYISVGALTHSAPCADVSLLFEESSVP